MTTQSSEISVDLPCHICGYDLRAHPQDGKCPECGASIAESRRLAAIPRRPAWRDSDPRWRRRMLAGAWILVLLPLMEALRISGWAASVPVPALLDIHGTGRTLDETFFYTLRVYQPLLFCIGVVLLFSKEHARRPRRLDWTRRWGVLCTYVSFLLSAVPILFITALVLAGIGALCLNIPLKYQPGPTQFIVNVSTTYLRYGPVPKEIFYLVLVAFSAIVILLACVPLFDALRSIGARRLMVILIAPLALFSLMHLAQAGRYLLHFPGVTSDDVFQYDAYFWSELFVRRLAGLPVRQNLSGSLFSAFLVEVAKWCIVFWIAVRLSIAQLAAWRHRK